MFDISGAVVRNVQFYAHHYAGPTEVFATGMIGHTAQALRGGLPFLCPRDDVLLRAHCAPALSFAMIRAH